ncbi:MAG: fumarylacetoacetate hydrolase family protein [Caulobacteraceae bacterium]
MVGYPFPPPPRPVVSIVGTDEVFPVRRIYCVGRNYAAHRREMGGDDREAPFFFAKPADAVVPCGGEVAYPPATHDFHHEVELVVALGGGGRDVAVADALDLVFGYAVGVDLTRRDLQAAAKDKGQPWDAAKGFDASAPISAFRRSEGAPPTGAIRLFVNGRSRQAASLSDMIWNVPEIVAEASKLWRLAPGDLIFTGTPEGVGPLVRGDEVEGAIDGVGDLTFRIV